MTDDERLRQLFDQVIPPATDTDVDQALTRVHRQAQTRQPRTHVIKPWLITAATAITVTAIITVAVIATRAGTHLTPAPPSSSSGLPSTGVWFRHATGSATTPTGTVDLAAVWVVRLSTSSRGSFDVRPADRFGTGNLQYDPATRHWSVQVLNRYCGATPGRYRITPSGPSLIFTAVSDSCTPRRDTLDGAVFAPLTNPNQLVG